MRGVLVSSWIATSLFLILLLDVSMWLAFVGYVIGLVFIHRYLATLAEDRSEREVDHGETSSSGTSVQARLASMTMTRAKERVLLIAAWTATVLALVYVAGVPAWLAFIGSLAGGGVIYNYAPPSTEETLTRGERSVRIGAYVVLGAVAALLALLLVVTLLAFLVAWLAS